MIIISLKDAKIKMQVFLQKYFSQNLHFYLDIISYKIYKSNQKNCKSCPLRAKCTKSKNSQKVITRHIWQDYKDEVNLKRYEELFKSEYPKRRETIERIFGDCKEQHSLRFTRVRGLEKNSNQALLIFACHNLKKMSLWNWEKQKKKKKESENTLSKALKVLKMIKILKLKKDKVIILLKNITLSTV